MPLLKPTIAVLILIPTNLYIALHVAENELYLASTWFVMTTIVIIFGFVGFVLENK